MHSISVQLKGVQLYQIKSDFKISSRTSFKGQTSAFLTNFAETEVRVF